MIYFKKYELLVKLYSAVLLYWNCTEIYCLTYESLHILWKYFKNWEQVILKVKNKDHS